uniref:hypothetical protein n=1 Tax=Thiolapillus sp. TaxID=2017437 RepID=UPI003AF7B844
SAGKHLPIAAVQLDSEYKALPSGEKVLQTTMHVTSKPYDFQACLRPRDRFWDIPVPKIDSAFDNLLVPQPSWSPSTTQQLRKLVAAPYLAPNDWTPRSEAYFVFPLAQGTPGKQCGLAATGVYQPSLRSPWLAAVEEHFPFRVRYRSLYAPGRKHMLAVEKYEKTSRIKHEISW